MVEKFFLLMDQHRYSDKFNVFIISLYASTIGMFLLLGLGKYLIIIFPLSSFCLGIFLCFRSPTLYIEYTLWMWFIGSFIRRLIDYQSGFLTPGPWNLSASLVTIISAESVIRNIFKNYPRHQLPFILCFGSVFYASILGLIQNPINDNVIIYNLNWFAPICFCFYIYNNWECYPDFIIGIKNTFKRGLALISAYGIYQFVIAPPWDKFFLERKQLLLQASSFGTPEPYGMRVWGTFGSPQSFGICIMASLLMLVYLEKFRCFYFIFIAFGYIALLLTRARTVWLAWVIGFIVLFIIRRDRYSVYLISSLIIIAGFIIYLITLGPLHEIIYPRIATFFDLSNDVSYQARIEGFNYIESSALSEIFGKGLGFSIATFGTNLGRNDSTILPLLLTFGWLGIIPYLLGILLLFIEVITSLALLDFYSSASFAISIAIFAQIGLLHIFVSSISVFFWFFLGVSLSGSRFFCYKNSKFKSIGYL